MNKKRFHVFILEKLNEHLALKECKLEDGSLVSNLEGICDMLIGRALIDKIANGSK